MNENGEKLLKVINETNMPKSHKERLETSIIKEDPLEFVQGYIHCLFICDLLNVQEFKALCEVYYY